MRLVRFTILTNFIFLVLSSCHFPVRVLTDEQIEKHYAGRPAKPELKYLRYKNYYIHHAVVGDSSKPLLLIVHGAPGAWYSSMLLLDNPDLQKNFHMVSVDRIGFGKSNYGVSEPSLQMHVKYLEKIVKKYNKGGKIYIMGSSYGAPIAASFAMQHSDLVEELYLVSPVIDPSTEKVFWFSYIGKLGLVANFLPEYLNVAGDEKFAHRRQLKRLRAHWSEITCKTYVFMGKKDWMADLANLDFARKMLVNAKAPQFYLLENTGHGIIYQHPELLVSILLKRDPSLVLH
jgi:pimeloyl-ACP methyl ester carboxylesterase